MPTTRKASASTTRAPFQPVSQPHEILSALMEILQRTQRYNDPETEKLVRSVITTAFKNQVDWSKIGGQTNGNE
jgi:hypothetical protein